MKIYELFKNDIKNNWFVFLIATTIIVGILLFANRIASSQSYYWVVVLALFLFMFVLITYIIVNNWRRDAKQKIVDKAKKQKSYHYYRLSYFTLELVYFLLVILLGVMITTGLTISEVLVRFFSDIFIILYLETYLLTLVFFYITKYVYLYQFKISFLTMFLLILLFFTTIWAFFTFLTTYLTTNLIPIILSFLLVTLINLIELGEINETKKLPVLELALVLIVLVSGTIGLFTTRDYQLNWITGQYQTDPYAPPANDFSKTEESEYGIATITHNDLYGYALTIEGDYNVRMEYTDNQYIIQITIPDTENEVLFEVDDNLNNEPMAAYYMLISTDDENDQFENEKCNNIYLRKEATLWQKLIQWWKKAACQTTKLTA